MDFGPHAMALAAVAAAAVYLLVRGWRYLRGRRSAGCGTCPTCPAGESDPTPSLVELKVGK
jgi:hypothetical protein